MSTEDLIDPIKPRLIGGAKDYSHNPSAVYLSFFWPFLTFHPPLPCYHKIHSADLASHHYRFKKAFVKLLVFDMGHVFIDFEWMAVCEGFCDHAGISFTDFKPILKHLASLGYERGNISTVHFVRELSDKLQKPLSIDEFSRIWNLTFRENPEMARLLENLKAHCPLYLLSNTNENHYSFIQSKFNVARHFDELILSYEVGAQKPEHKIYAEVLKRSGLPGSEIAFFDDLVTNIDAAKTAGIENSFLFTGIDDLKRDLLKLGVNF